MSSKRRADDSEEKKKTWLQRRLDQRTHLVQELLDIRHAVKERGIAALPPRPKMPEEFYLNPRVAVGHLAASSDPGSLMDQLVRQMAQSLAPWLELVGDGSLNERRRRRLNALDQAESYVDLGDAEALKKLLEEHKDAFMDGSLSALIAICAKRNQVECLDVCTRLFRMSSEEAIELRQCIRIALESPLDASAVIHYACARLVNKWRPLPLFSTFFWDPQIVNEKNALARLIWDAEGDTAETVRFDRQIRNIPSSFTRVGLFVKCLTGILDQTRFGARNDADVSWPDIPKVQFTETEDHKFETGQDVDVNTMVLEATEEFANVKAPDETFIKKIPLYGAKTRSGKAVITSFELLSVPKAFDVEMKQVTHARASSSPKTMLANTDRDMIYSNNIGDAVFAFYGMLGLPFSEAEREYVLDGSLWSPPSAEDLHGLPFPRENDGMLPVAIVTVSADTGTVVGYLSYVDCPLGDGVFTKLNFLFEPDVAKRTLPFGLPSFTKEPVTDPAVQVFYADVREKGIVCIANCAWIYIHYISDERVWDRVLSIVPFEKRARM